MPLPEAIRWLDRLTGLSGLSFTHDGAAVLATLSPSSAARGEALASRIWKFPVAGAPVQLTQGPGSDGRAVASPCDARIGFLSDRATPGKMELYLSEGGVDPRRLGPVSGTIEDLKWTQDAAAIVVLAADKGLNGGATNGATRLWWGDDEDPEVSTPTRALRRLFRIDLASGSVTDVGPPDLTVWEFDLLPDGAIAICSADPSERGWHHPRMVAITFADRQVRQVHQSDWQLQGLAASPDGRHVAVLEGWSSDRGLVAGEMRVIDLHSLVATTLAADVLSNATQMQWRDADSLWFTGWKNLGATYGIVGLDGRIQMQIDEDATIGENAFVASMAVSRDGILAAIRETVGQPQEIFVRSGLSGDWTQLGDVNGAVARGYPDYPDIRRIAWQGADGLALEALIFVPKGFGPEPGPMVVDIHGGPCMSAKYGFDPCGGLAWAAAGYVTFVPNYRGNVGWGQTFTRMNVGDPAGAEFDDIMAGVDACIAAELADPDRLGVTGASYGGYLSAWAVATTTRFKAAIPLSSICDQISSHYACEHDFHEFINGGPLSQPEFRAVAIDRSPLTRLDKPVTPTLLIQGREDRCTPLGQAQEFYAALKERGVATELVVYPREGHWLMETGHRHDAWARKFAWFDTYLRQSNMSPSNA